LMVWRAGKGQVFWWVRAEAEAGGMLTLQVTPFLLERIRSGTQGRSLEANIRLVKNNAGVGARVACSLAALQAAERAPS